MVDARSVNVKNTTTTTTVLMVLLVLLVLLVFDYSYKYIIYFQFGVQSGKDSKIYTTRKYFQKFRVVPDRSTLWVKIAIDWCIGGTKTVFYLAKI